MNKNQLYPTDLTDRQWDCIKELIPPAKPGGRPRSLQMRAVINAILYIVVSGAQWRMLPREYPAWQSVYSYFQQWRDDGTWQRLHDTLRAQVRERAGRHKHPTAGALDSQSVKMTQMRGVRGYDAGKKVNGRKRHLLVDTRGLLLAVLVTAAAVSDPAGARLLLRRLGGACKKLRRIWVDGPYVVTCWSGSYGTAASSCSPCCAAMGYMASWFFPGAGWWSVPLPGSPNVGGWARTMKSFLRVVRP